MYLILFNVCCIGHGHNTAGGSDGCFRDGTDSEGQGARLDRAHRWRGTEDRQGRDQLQVRYIDLRAAAGGLRRLGLPRAGRRRCGDRAVRTYVRRRAPRGASAREACQHGRRARLVRHRRVRGSGRVARHSTDT